MSNLPNNGKAPFSGINIGGLYQRTRERDGQMYLTGKFGFAGARILVLPNPEKNNNPDPKIPDFNMVLVEDKPKEHR